LSLAYLLLRCLVDLLAVLAGGRSPFLGAQVAIGRWPLPKEPPPPRRAPQSVTVRDRAVITGSYVGVVGAGQLPDAEEEAKRLLDAWPGAKRIPATWREVIDCLKGDPPADVLHFALHGKFDQSGRQEGIFLIGKQPDKDDQYRVEILPGPADGPVLLLLHDAMDLTSTGFRGLPATAVADFRARYGGRGPRFRSPHPFGVTDRQCQGTGRTRRGFGSRTGHPGSRTPDVERYFMQCQGGV
jgi:hypothetical protein